jgi:hypothetical protein
VGLCWSAGSGAAVTRCRPSSPTGARRPAAQPAPRPLEVESGERRLRARLVRDSDEASTITIEDTWSFKGSE